MLGIATVFNIPLALPLVITLVCYLIFKADVSVFVNYGLAYVLYTIFTSIIEIEGYTTAVYIRLVWENDKYVVKFIDNKPEGYDEYVARMKEHGIDVENIDYPSLINAKVDIKEEIQAAEKKEFNSKQTAISFMNKIIITVCGVLIFLIIMINFMINKKVKKS